MATTDTDTAADIGTAATDAVILAQQSGLTGNVENAFAALAVGLAALGAGIAERGIGAAAVGATAEDDAMFGRGLILTVLPETLVILALVTVFVVGT